MTVRHVLQTRRPIGLKLLWCGGWCGQNICMGKSGKLMRSHFPKLTKKNTVLTKVEATTGWLETYPVPHAIARNTILGLEKEVLG